MEGSRRSHRLWGQVQEAVKDKSYTLFEPDYKAQITAEYELMNEQQRKALINELKGILGKSNGNSVKEAREVLLCIQCFVL